MKCLVRVKGSRGWGGQPMLKPNGKCIVRLKASKKRKGVK